MCSGAMSDNPAMCAGACKPTSCRPACRLLQLGLLLTHTGRTLSIKLPAEGLSEAAKGPAWRALSMLEALWD
jgi:hypothetical protein